MNPNSEAAKRPRDFANQMIYGFILLFCTQLLATTTKAEIDSVNAIPYEYVVSNTHQALKIFTKNASDAQAIGYKYGQAHALDQVRVANFVMGRYEASARAALQAMKLFEELDALPELAELYGRYGYQIRRRDAKRGEEYLLRALALAKQEGFNEVLCTLYDNYGILQEERGQLDSALTYYQQALALKRVCKDTIGLPYSLNNIAGIYASKGDYTQALKIARESDVWRKKEKGDFGRAMNLVLFGEIYFQMQQLDSAYYYFDRCLKSSLKLNFTDLARYTYQKLSAVHELRGEYQQALENQKKFIAYKDSIVNLKTNAKISELEVAYETEQKDHELDEKELQLRKKATQLLIALSIIGALLTVVFFVTRLQSLRREKLRRELELKNQLKQVELERKIADEKVRISRELHDNIGSHLTFMISSVDNLSYMMKDEKLQPKLNRLSTFGRTAMAELRSSIWAMNHEDGELKDLILKMNDVKQQLDLDDLGPEIQIRNDIKHPVFLTAVQMINIYRIVQEAVQNAVKYSDASRIRIIFTEEAKGFSLHIEDNGNGFDPQKVQSGNGLRNMRQRCTDADGALSVDSGSKGTVISCRFC